MSKELFPRVIDGTWMGCTDGGPPEGMDAQDLSQIYDALRVIKVRCGDTAAMNFFQALPDRVKLNFSWTRWRYVSPG